MACAVERRPDQLGHPGIDDDLAPAALAHVQDARDEPAGPGDERATGLDREAVRSPVLGDALEELGDLAREAVRPRDGFVERQDRESPADVERVERRQAAAQQRDDRQPAPDGVAPGVDGAQLGADVEMDPARPDRPPACVVSHSTRPVASVSVRPNFEVPSPTASPGIVSGTTSGLRRTRTSSAGGRFAKTGAPGHARSRLGFIRRSRATQARGGLPAAVARTAARRSASVLPIPSSVIRPFGTPARLAIAHSPRDTTFAPNPRAVTLRDDLGPCRSALIEYCRTHG